MKARYTVLFLTTLGKTIELIPPSHIPGNHNPDFFMDGLIWETKSPAGSSDRMTLERILHKAAKQSENIIIDLRRTGLPDSQSIPYLKRRFRLSRRINHLLIITKQNNLIDADE